MKPLSKREIENDFFSVIKNIYPNPMEHITL